MQLLIAAGVPSAIVAFVSGYWKDGYRNVQKRRKTNGHADKKNRMTKRRTVRSYST